MDSTESYVYQVCLLGAARVGKSSIIKMLTGESLQSSYSPTLEVTHHFRIRSNYSKYLINVIDTSGSLLSPSMRQIYFSRADIFVLTYDLLDDSTYQEVRTIQKEIVDVFGFSNVPPIMVVGTKADELKENHKTEQIIQELTASVEWDSVYLKLSTHSKEGALKFTNLLFEQVMKAENHLEVSRDPSEDDPEFLKNSNFKGHRPRSRTMTMMSPKIVRQRRMSFLIPLLKSSSRSVDESTRKDGVLTFSKLQCKVEVRQPPTRNRLGLKLTENGEKRFYCVSPF